MEVITAVKNNWYTVTLNNGLVFSVYERDGWNVFQIGSYNRKIFKSESECWEFLKYFEDNFNGENYPEFYN